MPWEDQEKTEKQWIDVKDNASWSQFRFGTFENAQQLSMSHPGCFIRILFDGLWNHPHIAGSYNPLYRGPFFHCASRHLLNIADPLPTLTFLRHFEHPGIIFPPSQEDPPKAGLLKKQCLILWQVTLVLFLHLPPKTRGNDITNPNFLHKEKSGKSFEIFRPPKTSGYGWNPQELVVCRFFLLFLFGWYFQVPSCYIPEN